jgi:hypothetical protein
MTNQKPNHQLIIGSSLGYWKQTEIGSDFQNWNLFIYLFIYLGRTRRQTKTILVFKILKFLESEVVNKSQD